MTDARGVFSVFGSGVEHKWCVPDGTRLSGGGPARPGNVPEVASVGHRCFPPRLAGHDPMTAPDEGLNLENVLLVDR